MKLLKKSALMLCALSSSILLLGQLDMEDKGGQLDALHSLVKLLADDISTVKTSFATIQNNVNMNNKELKLLSQVIDTNNDVNKSNLYSLQEKLEGLKNKVEAMKGDVNMLLDRLQR